MLICGGLAVDPAARTVTSGPIGVADGRIIVADGAPAEPLVEADGLFVLPGLIDAHTHLVPFLSPDAGARVSSAARAMRETVAAGVTTVRDLGGDLAAVLAARRMARGAGFLGSDVLVAGPMLTVPHGHGSASSHGLALSSPAEMAAVVHALCDAGVDHIKVVTSGANGLHQMPVETMRVAIDTARSRSRPVAVHAHLQEEQIAAAVELGATTIEHGFALHRRPATIGLMARQGTYLCPTLRVIESVRQHPDHYGQRLIPAAWQDAIDSVAAAASAGVKLIAGTDAGIFGVTGADLWREVSLISDCTGSRWDGLRAATCIAAEALGLTDRGNLSRGSRADLVLLRRDPLVEDINARDVALVIREGQPVGGDGAGCAQ
jgi:imidazolonepropionase-like amidohydrolase